MTVVIVTRNAAGEQRKVEWFENEHDYYAAAPFRRLTFNTAFHLWECETLRCHTIGPAVDLQAADTLVRLRRNPWADVSDVATHYCPEPGAPLEPITLGGAA